MDAKIPEINLGETICEKLKIIYNLDTHWVDCHQNIAQKFTKLKQIMRKFYSDKTDIEILQELQRYSLDDIKEAIENE